MSESYERATPASKRLSKRAEKVFAGGVNHNARYYEPYPLFVSRAQGAHIWDADGNRYTDYWMGHLALILGHSPRVVTDALREQIGRGTHYGMGSEAAVELGEEVQKSVPCAEMMRFCNTGAEATMYLVRLARGYTGRKTIIKMEGGWHGYNTELNKAVHSPFDRPEGVGILGEEQVHVMPVRFNDIQAAEKGVRASRGDTAAILLEPVLGAGGCVPADKEYLKGLRELADRSGALLAFDEVITGFRLALGGAQEYYRVTPDLAAMGKVVGGGLPIGMVCGRADIVSRADPRRKERLVSIGGGTFSENPLTMAAGLATLRYLRRNKLRIYSELSSMGAVLRKGLERIFGETGPEARGIGSIFMAHFGKSGKKATPHMTANQYALGLMASGIFTLPGHPCALSTCHTETDVKALLSATESLFSRP